MNYLAEEVDVHQVSTGVLVDVKEVGAWHVSCNRPDWNMPWVGTNPAKNLWWLSLDCTASKQSTTQCLLTNQGRRQFLRSGGA